MSDLRELFRTVQTGVAQEPLLRVPETAGMRASLIAVCLHSGPVYREHVERIGLDGQSTWREVVYSLPFQHVPAQLVTNVVDGVQTYALSPDVFRTGSQFDVALNDVLYQLRGDWPGQFWRVVSVPAKFTRRAMVQEFQTRRLLLTPAGLLDALASEVLV